jgi:hypothetical protein
VPEPGNPQYLNRYSYVRNNPVRFSDPTGHWDEDELRIASQWNRRDYCVNDLERTIYDWLLAGDPEAVYSLY